MGSEGTRWPSHELTQGAAGITAWRAAGLCWSRELYLTAPCRDHYPAPDQISLERSLTALTFGGEFGEEHEETKPWALPDGSVSNRMQKKKLRCSYDMPDGSKSALNQHNSFAVPVSPVGQR